MTNQIAETIREKIDPMGVAGGLRRHAPVHVDARRREAELVRGDERDDRHLPRQRAHAAGVPRSHQAARHGDASSFGAALACIDE
jgi:hypothetical protein